MHSWNPRTVLSWNGKAWAYQITGPFDMRRGLFRMQEGLFNMYVSVIIVGDGLA